MPDEKGEEVGSAIAVVLEDLQIHDEEARHKGRDAVRCEEGGTWARQIPTKPVPDKVAEAVGADSHCTKDDECGHVSLVDPDRPKAQEPASRTWVRAGARPVWDIEAGRREKVYRGVQAGEREIWEALDSVEGVGVHDIEQVSYLEV